MIAAFARHLIDRYGIDEVSQWYFEVWNEPNIDFWAGEPKQATYFELYDHTARALKSVNPRIRVGGPATAQAAWVSDMIAHATENHVPLDFVSTHVYGNDSAENVFHDSRSIAPHGLVCEAVRKVHEEIEHSAQPGLPLIWSEFNATYSNQQEITDSIYMGPWLADTIRRCDGLTEMMSYWTFSDVFEEQGVIKTPFYGGFGIVGEDGIPKPAFDAFELLHALGTERLPMLGGRCAGHAPQGRHAGDRGLEPGGTGATGANKTIDLRLQRRCRRCARHHPPSRRRAWRYAGCVEEDGQSAVSHAGADRRAAQSSGDGPATGRVPARQPAYAYPAAHGLAVIEIH